MNNFLNVPVAVRSRTRFTKFVILFICVTLLIVLACVLVVGEVVPHFYIITTTSMVPTLKPGDLVIVQHVNPDKIKVGDIIAFNVVVYDLDNPVPVNLGFTITHRVVDIVRYDNRTYFVTKGDANTVTDPWYVPASYVIGIVHKIASLGTLGLVLASPRGKALILALVVLTVLIVYYLYNTYRAERTVV